MNQLLDGYLSLPRFVQGQVCANEKRRGPHEIVKLPVPKKKKVEVNQIACSS